MDDKILEGTTTVGITCKDGVVFASERRASMGNLVAHKVAEKIFKINDHIVTTIAGSVECKRCCISNSKHFTFRTNVCANITWRNGRR